jgi:hypothetical protein
MTRGLTAWLFLFACLLPARVDACSFVGSSPWFATEAELAASTAEIFIGRVTSQRSDGSDPTSFRREYELEVQERIKGNPPVRVWIGGFTPVARPDPRGRVSFGSDCRMQAQFEVGQRYLVFRNAFHPKGYEHIAAGQDAWLETVRRLVLILSGSNR